MGVAFRHHRQPWKAQPVWKTLPTQLHLSTLTTSDQDNHNTHSAPGGQVAVCRRFWVLLSRKEELARFLGRKFFAGSIMSTLKLSPESLCQIRELAAQWGKTAATRAGRELGTEAQLTFSDMERFALAVAAEVAQSTLVNLFNSQAQALPPDQPCPQCKELCQVNYQDRPITLETGQVVQLHEPICHCPHCRRDFFPPADAAASGRTPLQPRRSQDDR